MIGIPGVFKMCDTIGLPLEVAILECSDRGYVVAWDAFVDDARAHGWTDKTIHRKIAGAVEEAMGGDYAAEHEKRLIRYMGKS